jgi:hypothetical protein
MEAFMSQSEAGMDFAVLAAAFADRCEASLEMNNLSAASDEALSKALVAAIRLFAAKAQNGETPALVQGNHAVSATDGAIFATAVLEAVGIEVFELAAWQACSNVGSRRHINENVRGEQ